MTPFSESHEALPTSYLRVLAVALLNKQSASFYGSDKANNSLSVQKRHERIIIHSVHSPELFYLDEYSALLDERVRNRKPYAA